MNARPLYSKYREDDGTTHMFLGRGWDVTAAFPEDHPDVSLGCWPRTYAHYHHVYFEFEKK